jgi:hypothetical protein
MDAVSKDGGAIHSYEIAKRLEEFEKNRGRLSSRPRRGRQQHRHAACVDLASELALCVALHDGREASLLRTNRDRHSISV